MCRIENTGIVGDTADTLLGLHVLFGLEAAFKHFYSNTPDMSDWNEDWSHSRPMGTVCCATVDVKVCLLSVDTSLYP